MLHVTQRKNLSLAHISSRLVTPCQLSASGMRRLRYTRTYVIGLQGVPLNKGYGMAL